MTPQAYLQQMVETAPPMRLITMLFERGRTLMEEAEQALREQRWEEAHFDLVKTQRIVAELIGSLDLEAGGEIAHRLRQLYTFVWERLLEANLRKAIEPLQEARTVWEMLHTTWEEVAQRVH